MQHIQDVKMGTQAHAAYKGFIQFLKTRFELKEGMDGMSHISSFLGMNVTWTDDRSWVRIDQSFSIEKLVTGSGVTINIPRYTPLPPGTEIMLTDSP